ncbi:hypothetical protein H8958_002599 [Nasalis larvatus]
MVTKKPPDRHPGDRRLHLHSCRHPHPAIQSHTFRTAHPQPAPACAHRSEAPDTPRPRPGLPDPSPSASPGRVRVLAELTSSPRRQERLTEAGRVAEISGSASSPSECASVAHRVDILVFVRGSVRPLGPRGAKGINFHLIRKCGQSFVLMTGQLCRKESSRELVGNFSTTAYSLWYSPPLSVNASGLKPLYLVSYQSVHTGEKPYEFTECGGTFTHMSHFIEHRSHAEEKPCASKEY